MSKAWKILLWICLCGFFQFASEAKGVSSSEIHKTSFAEAYDTETWNGAADSLLALPSSCLSSSTSARQYQNTQRIRVFQTRVSPRQAERCANLNARLKRFFVSLTLKARIYTPGYILKANGVLII